MFICKTICDMGHGQKMKPSERQLPMSGNPVLRGLEYEPGASSWFTVYRLEPSGG